ncbi:TPA: hypothetical protein ACH3X1_000880 [Trebouxia sp. C0004]
MFQPHVESPAASSTTPSAPPASKKRRRQEQSVIEWVQGLPDRHLVQPPRNVGLDPGRKALFTAVVHSQQAADSLHGGRLCQSKYASLSWSCSRWREASGIKFRLQKVELWISRKPALDAALKATPTAKVASSAQFLQHIRTGCSTQQQHRFTTATGATGSCADGASSSGSRPTLQSARPSVEAAVTLLWLMEMQSSAAAAARGTLAHLECH